MDRHLAIAQRLTASLGEDCLNFRPNGEGDFFRRFGAEIQTGRRKKLGRNRNAAVEQIAQQLIAPLARSEQAYIAEIELKQVSQRGEIPAVVMRLNDGRRASISLSSAIRLRSLLPEPTNQETRQSIAMARCPDLRRR